MRPSVRVAVLPAVVAWLLVVGAIAVLLYQGAALWLAREMPRLDPAPRAAVPPGSPKVSVVIAARDEESDLPATLDDVLAQDYPNLEVVVVDGGSRDGTGWVVDARAPRVRRLEEPPLPAGWVGKNWACATGAAATSGEWLLFLDADVRLDPSAVRTTLGWAQREGAAIASIAPCVEAVGLWERLVLPFYVQMVLTYFRAPHVNRARSRSAMANGQFWLVRRHDYEALGGHAAVRGAVLEDVAIARRARAAGSSLRIAWAPSLASTRMYRDRHEMFEGILKNVHGTEFSAARQFGFLAALVGLFWLPLGLLPLGLAVGSIPLAGLGAFLTFALFGKHAAFSHAVGTPASYGLLYPVAVGFYVAVVATSLGRGWRGRPVRWKGREYPLGSGPPPEGLSAPTSRR
jgi:chlorobactene glucosyltransferase